ncbi:MAG: hypothetical protein RLZ97_509, partial [Verrucomicrobiota bacterium]
MKRPYRAIGSLAVVPVLIMTGCEKKETPAAQQATETVKQLVEDAVETVTPAAPGLSAEERAPMLGIAAHVSADVDGFASVMGGREAMKGLAGLDSWAFIREVAKEEGGMDPQDQINEGVASVDPFLGDEFSLVFGSGWSETVRLYTKFAQRLNYHQGRAIGAAFAQGAVGGDFEESFSSLEDGAWMAGMVQEIGPMVDEFENFKMPSMLGALRIKDEEARKMAFEQISSISAMMGEEAEPVSFEKAGAQFSGIRFAGESLATDLEESR